LDRRRRRRFAAAARRCQIVKSATGGRLEWQPSRYVGHGVRYAPPCLRRKPLHYLSV